ncbi:MAG: GTPase Era [Vampirovibrionales bacterium]
MPPTTKTRSKTTKAPSPARPKKETPESNVPHRSGFVALVGRPNVGKSTLMNKLLGQKIAITSPVMQTTRHRIRGIITIKHAQLVLLDTPGFSKPIDALGSYLVEEGQAALSEADTFGVVMDITSPPGPGDAWVIHQVQAAAGDKPILLILNKNDRIRGNTALNKERTVAYTQLFGSQPPKRVVHISAKTGKHIQNLEEALFGILPIGPRFYEPDTVTDQRIREITAELIREQVLHLTHDELPHSIAVGIEHFDESDPALIRISATVYVNQPSQKGMVIGKSGEMIKTIGTQARKAIEAMVETQVFLELNVKLKKQWRKDDAFLQAIGLAPPSN